MKTQHLELILTALAESIESHRRDRAMDLNNHLEMTGRAMERLTALWEIQDVISHVEMSKRDKLNAISGIVEVALNPDIGVDDDWGYQ